MEFANIKEIAPGDESTWQTKLFLTFDVDWANDAVLHDTIDIVEKADVPATWFITHDTLVLQRLRQNPKFEIGIHPNFNFLLNGSSKQGKTAEEVVGRILETVPEAKSVRSHSMTQNSNILQLFVDKRLTHDVNHFIPEQINLPLQPWFLWNDLIKVPYFWEDDVVCLYKENSPLNTLVKRPGLKVFDFHPIHVYLNTEDLARYEKSRHVHHDIEKLHQYRNRTTVGARDHLETLLSFSTNK